MLEMYDTRPTKPNNSTEIRDYIKTYKKDIYKMPIKALYFMN